MRKNHSVLLSVCILLFSLLLTSSAHSKEFDLVRLGHISTSEFHNIHLMAASKSYLFLVNRSKPATLFSIDISDPSNPIKISEYSADNLYYTFGFERGPIRSMAIEWPYLYLPVRGGFDILDINDPSRPMKVGAYRFSNNQGNYTAGLINVHQGRVLVTVARIDRLEMVDARDVHSPQILSRLEPEPNIMEYMKVLWDSGIWAYAMVGWNPIGNYSSKETRVIDLSDFANARIASTIPTEQAQDMWVEKDMIMVNKPTSGPRPKSSIITVYNIRDRNNPLQVNSFPLDAKPSWVGKYHPFPFILSRNLSNGRLVVYRWNGQILEMVKDFPRKDTPERLLIHDDMLIGIKVDNDGPQGLNIFQFITSSLIPRFEYY